MSAPGFYSQYGEDVKLADLFAQHKTGVCIEVGGNDGVTGSNTLHFEQLGWTCVLIEPIPWIFEALRKNRTGLAFQCAASDHDGELELVVGRGQEQLASLESGRRTKEAGAAQERIRVRTRRLDDILAEAGITVVDFVSIDVEGHEYSVLCGFVLAKHRPRFLIVEASLDRRVEQRLNANGYVRFCVTGANDWYARSDDPAVDPAQVRQLAADRAAHWRSLGWRPRLSQWAQSILPTAVVRWLRRLRERVS